VHLHKTPRVCSDMTRYLRYTKCCIQQPGCLSTIGKDCRRVPSPMSRPVYVACLLISVYGQDPTNSRSKGVNPSAAHSERRHLFLSSSRHSHHPHNPQQDQQAGHSHVPHSHSPMLSHQHHPHHPHIPYTESEASAPSPSPPTSTEGALETLRTNDASDTREEGSRGDAVMVVMDGARVRIFDNAVLQIGG